MNNLQDISTHDSVLIIDLDDDYRRIISQFTSLTIELHIIKHQQLIPCRTQRLIQDLRGNNQLNTPFLLTSVCSRIDVAMYYITSQTVQCSTAQAVKQHQTTFSQ